MACCQSCFRPGAFFYVCFNTSKNADCGIETRPTIFILAFPFPSTTLAIREAYVLTHGGVCTGLWNGLSAFQYLKES